MFEENALPEFSVSQGVRMNDVYFVTGQKNELGDDLIRFLCFLLWQSGARDVSCFCPEERMAFYRTFIPPAWVSELTEASLKTLFTQQEENMRTCEAIGSDPREREKLKDKFARVLIIDRARYFSEKSDKVAHWAVLNNGLMHCRENRLTVIYRNISDKAWEKTVPAQLLNSETATCFIVSCVSPDHLKEAKRHFGGIKFETLKTSECADMLISEALFPENGICGVISKRAVSGTDVAGGGRNSAERWAENLAKFSVPQGSLKSFKFGDPKLWSNYAPRTSESVSEKSGFDSGMLDLLNAFGADKVRIGLPRC
jgi:hypothetical protein